MALPALVGECLALVRPLALARSVRLLPTQHLPTATLVRADPLRLKQVLLNLLGNAIKYNHAGGEVQVRWHEHGEQVVLDVHDTGPGLSAAQQQRLFQPFERLEAAQSGIEGAGIGLALSRRLVEGMAGGIGVDSALGAGSRFWVRLPRAVVPPLPGPQAQLPRAVPPVPQRAVHALYIEDNEVNALLVGAMLQRLPWLRLSIATLPAEGLALALHERPQLVLLDIQMPGMDGFEVLARLRADPAMREAPVIAVSANARQDDIDAALAAGFDAYLTKPVEMDSLIAAVLEAVTPSAQVARS
jgi:CheY-like chemotaxis protein/anti-sigma regulatory factor (Ser/Thr protein kinase)